MGRLILCKDNAFQGDTDFIDRFLPTVSMTVSYTHLTLPTTPYV